MNLLEFHPSDVLIFRDGRPMSGSLAGHTAAWPSPDVTNHALHAALHRAELEVATGIQSVRHRRGRSGRYSGDSTHVDRQFGSLLTAGPFPVRREGAAAREKGVRELNEEEGRIGRWFFPRPRDAQERGTAGVTYYPASTASDTGTSLPAPLKYAVPNSREATKEEGPEPWISARAFEDYLREPRGGGRIEGGHFVDDDEVALREARLGIAIDPKTQLTGQGDASGQIYTAHYLRLQDEFRLGLVAAAAENRDERQRDLIQDLFPPTPTRIVVGGQQRTCTAIRREVGAALPLPKGLSAGFQRLDNQRFAVKWILLSPALWPVIDADPKRRIQSHPGGWLPNWIDPGSGQVLLRTGDTGRHPGETRGDWRSRVQGLSALPDSVRLVAAIVPRPQPVTGWATPTPTREEGPDGGAKSTHLAVPAGAVYYFEVGSEDDARALAGALNWHGTGDPRVIRNRRSTLLGEKGYGLGVCGTWSFHSPVTLS